MARYRYRHPVLRIVPVTLTPAQKGALSRRSRTLHFALVRRHGDLHYVAQMLHIAHVFDCYELKHAALALWDEANAETQVQWEREAATALHIMLNARGKVQSDPVMRMVRELFGDDAPPKRRRPAPKPGELRLRPHYLTPVRSYPTQAGGD